LTDIISASEKYDVSLFMLEEKFCTLKIMAADSSEILTIYQATLKDRNQQHSVPTALKAAN
jgi:hypothetical protein